MFIISGRTGFTLPGIILEPGWTAGNRISSNPDVGPDASNRRSLAIRLRVSAIERIAPINWQNQTWIAYFRINYPKESISGGYALTKQLPYVEPYSGWVFRPVPTAVPPIPSRSNPSPGYCLNSRYPARSLWRNQRTLAQAVQEPRLVSVSCQILVLCQTHLPYLQELNSKGVAIVR